MSSEWSAPEMFHRKNAIFNKLRSIGQNVGVTVILRGGLKNLAPTQVLQEKKMIASIVCVWLPAQPYMQTSVLKAIPICITKLS